MDLLIRPESKGIHYEGYDNEFIQCVFEDADISGRNERYEFRCRPDLECCGRLCCTPQGPVIPFWLIILFIVLALLLMSVLLGAIAWLCCKSKEKPKRTKPKRMPLNRQDIRGTGIGAYRSYKQDESQEALSPEDRLMENAYSTPADDLYNNQGDKAHVYKNPIYTPKNIRQRNTDDNVYDKAGSYRTNMIIPMEKTPEMNDTIKMNNARNNMNVNSSFKSAPHGYFREIFEEKFEEKYEIEEDKTESETDSKNSQEIAK